MNTIVSMDTRNALSVGQKNHWQFRVVGKGDLPNKPVYKNEWWYEELTSQTIPPQGKERLDALRKAGVSMKGVIVAHEAPKLLAAPKQAQEKPERKVVENGDSKITASTDILGVLGTLASVLAMGFVLFLSLFAQAVLIDPALIVVLEDGTYVEVMTWLD